MALKPIRIKEMEQFIAEEGFVSIPQLCERFGISKNTARADVAELVNKKVIKKRYGGVESLLSADVPEFMERRMTNAELKSAIGAAARSLINEGDIIYIDSGSSSLSVLENTKDMPKDITVITCSLGAIQLLAEEPDINTVVLPGNLIHRTNSFLSIDTFSSLSQYNITKAFIGTTGLSEDGFLSTSTQSLSRLKKEAIRIAKEAFLLADASKIGKTCMTSFANLSDFSGWICDGNSEYAKKLAGTFDVNFIGV